MSKYTEQEKEEILLAAQAKVLQLEKEISEEEQLEDLQLELPLEV